MSEKTPRRAIVTLKFDLLSAAPITVSDEELAQWLSDRMGRVTDNGPYEIGTGGARQEIDFGPVWWEDSAVYRDPEPMDVVRAKVREWADDLDHTAPSLNDHALPVVKAMREWLEADR